MSEKICILIPTYNRKDKLKRTLNALIRQTSQDFNVIISDNCGNYDVNELVRELPTEFQSKIQIFRNSYNVGMCGNFAILLLKTNCKWTWLISDDDKLSLKAVEVIQKSIQAHENSAWLDFPFFCGNQITDNAKEIKGIKEFIEFSEVAMNKVGADFTNNLWYVTDKVYNMEIMGKYMNVFFENLFSAGPHIFFILKALSDGCRCTFFPDLLVEYDDSDGVSWNKKNVFAHSRTLVDMPFELSKFDFKRLCKIVAIPVNTILYTNYAEPFQKNDLYLYNLYHDLYRNFIPFKSKVKFILLMNLEKTKQGYDFIHKIWKIHV